MWQSLFLILILFSSNAFAQVQEKPKAVKIDEFGKVSECQIGAILDSLIMEWQANQKSGIYIIQYNGINELPADLDGKFSRINQSLVRNHLRFRDFNSNRVKFINGGFREEFTQEFWLVPEGAEIPRPSNTLPKPVIPTDKTFQFASEYLVAPYADDPIEFFNAKDQAELLKAEKEEEIERKKNGETEKEIKFYKEILEEMKFGWAVSSFGEILRDREGATGTIIFYADDERYSMKNIRKHVEEGKRRIAKESNISPNRIQVIFGGYRNMPQAEFWIIPRGGKLPEPTPEKQEN